MMQTTLDRVSARALVDAGYMSVGRYIEMFGDEVREEVRRAQATEEARVRPWQVPAHFERPIAGRVASSSAAFSYV